MRIGEETAAWCRGAWVPLLLGWVAGHALQLTQAAAWPPASYAALALTGLAVLTLAVRSRWAGGRGAIAVVVACALLGWAHAGWRAAQLLMRQWPAALDGLTIEARWRVTGLPRQEAHGATFEARVLAWGEAAQGRRPPPAETVGTLRVSWRGAPSPRVLPGQVWQGTLRLQRPRGLANPFGFDAEAWAWREGIAASASVLPQPQPPRLISDEPWQAPMARARTAVRDALWARLHDRFGQASTGLVVALVTGEQAAIPPPSWEVIRATGVAHLVAISGLHVTMLAALALWSVGWLWRTLGARWPALILRWPASTVAAAIAVAVAGSYAWFAGGGVPAQRTVVMLALVLGLRATGRAWPWPLVWLAALAAALGVDPWAWLQAGFWLSFVAVAVLMGRCQAQAVVPEGGRRWLAWLGEQWRAQAAVTVALAPLLLWWFGQVSIVGLLANLLAIPWITWGVTPLALMGVVADPLADAAAWLAQGWWAWLEALARWPVAVWQRPAVPVALSLAATLGALVLVQPWPWSLRAWGALMLWPALAFRPPAPAPGTFEVLLPDVGQGTAVIVRTARHTLVVDTGPAPGVTTAAERVVLPWLRALGARADAVVLSHDDVDHAGGWRALASAYPQAGWWAPRGQAPPAAAAVQACTAGQGWEWDGIPFVFLHPPERFAAAADDGNAHSCVLLIGRGRQAALLPGDIPAAVEQALVAAYPGLRTGLLVAAHHGSRSSTSAVWLDTLQPRVVAIQAGARNAYGHPHAEVLQRLRERGVAAVATPQCGAITWRSTAPDRWQCERSRRRFYWQGPGVSASAEAAGAAGDAQAAAGAGMISRGGAAVSGPPSSR